jgi:FixJ family two-component response regulator
MPTKTARLPTVVLVDDDLALRLSLNFILELNGFVVETLDSGEALLAHALPKPPACLVLDQNMDGISGLDALRQLRARGVSLPAIMITSDAKPRFRRTAAGLGATVVEKPLHGDHLRVEIEAALAGRRDAGQLA